MTHQAGAYPGFCSMKRIGVFLLPPGWDASPSQGYPSITLAGTRLYTWVERGTVRVKCLAQEHNTIGPLQDPVTWYGINYAGTQVTQWDFQNKGTRTSAARLSFVLEVPLRNLRPSVINSVPCDRILQRAYFAGLGSNPNRSIRKRTH